MASGMLSGQEISKTLEPRALENAHTRDSSLLLRMELAWAALGCTDPEGTPSPDQPWLTQPANHTSSAAPCLAHSPFLHIHHSQGLATVQSLCWELEVDVRARAGSSLPGGRRVWMEEAWREAGFSLSPAPTPRSHFPTPRTASCQDGAPGLHPTGGLPETVERSRPPGSNGYNIYMQG